LMGFSASAGRVDGGCSNIEVKNGVISSDLSCLLYIAVLMDLSQESGH
jgi:hypothetical protein